MEGGVEECALGAAIGALAGVWLFGLTQAKSVLFFFAEWERERDSHS